jgi:hypothetical protein
MAFRQKNNIVDRFFSKLIMIPFHTCWEWIGNKRPDGYGRLNHNKQQYRAHRLSWILHFGDIPEDFVVCHSCDNPSCVNPHHLFIGTDGDNTRDRNAKGRANMPKGEDHHRCKLSSFQIKEIRESQLSSRKLAKQFKVSHRNILAIKNYKSWKHL